MSSPQQPTQQAIAVQVGPDLVATFDNRGGYYLARVTISGPQVPPGSHCAIYQGTPSDATLLTVVDKTDLNNWNPPGNQYILPGNPLIVVWQNVSGYAAATIQVRLQ